QDISTIFFGWVRVSLTGAVAVDIVISFYWLDFGGRPKMDLLGVGVVFGPIARIQFGARMTPTWFFICSTLRDAAQSLNNSSGDSGNCGGAHCARRRVHEGEKPVRETRHGTSDADAPDVWAAANPVHPTAFGDVAVHHRSPASQFHYALRRTIDIGEISLFIIAASVTSFVYSFAKHTFGS